MLRVVIIGCFWISTFALLNLNGELRLPILSSELFLIVAICIAAYVISRRGSFFDSPIYLTFCSYLLFLGIGPLVVHMVDPFSFEGELLTDVGAWPLLVSWIGLASLGLGYWVARFGGVGRRRVFVTAREIPSGNIDVLLNGGIALTVVGVVGVCWYLAKAGGVSFLLETSYNVRINPSIIDGVYNMLRPGLLLLTARYVGARRRSTVWSIALLVFIGCDLLWFGPLRGSRRQVITLVLALICIAKYCRPPGRASGYATRWRRPLLVVGVAFALVLGALRTYSVRDLLAAQSSELNVTPNTRDETVLALYEPFDSFVRIVELVPGSIPYQQGRTFYESFSLFIPRDLWSAKPKSIADWLTETLYGPNLGGNTAATWPGELYLNFGVIGVMIGLAALGAICAWATRFTASVNAGPVSVSQGLHAAVWFPWPFEWIWGGSNPAVWYLLYNVLPVCGVIWLARRGWHRRFSPFSSGADANETRCPAL